MSQPARMSACRTYPLTVEHAFDTVLALPLETLFNRRYGPIPAIRSVDSPDGPWSHVGQERTIHLAGGGSMRERLTALDRPDRFAYELDRVTGPMKLLAARVEGSWSFAPAGTGVRITWSWTVHPASAIGAALLPAFTVAWREYARRALQRLEDLLV